MSAQQGKRVIVIMRSGEHRIKKFKENKGNVIEFMDGDTIPTKEIRTLSIYKPTGKQPNEEVEE